MKGFLSYAHHNAAECATFRAHLTALRRGFSIDVWTDHEINAGTVWEDRIADAIAAANIFFLLISPAFIDSDYVYTKEIPAIKDRRRTDNALVLPIVLARCDWKLIAGSLQAVPMKAGKLTPIIDWRPTSNGYDQARAEMAKAITDHAGMTPTGIKW